MAVASGVKCGDDYRGPRLRRGLPAISTDWLRPASKEAQDSWRATAARHSKSLSCARVLSLANLNIQKSLKHSNKRRWKAQMSTRTPCSMRTQRAESHGQRDRTELSFTSSCTWTNKYKSQFKHANRESCLKSNSEFSSSCSCTDKYIENYIKKKHLWGSMKKLPVMS